MLQRVGWARGAMSEAERGGMASEGEIKPVGKEAGESFATDASAASALRPSSIVVTARLPRRRSRPTPPPEPERPHRVEAPLLRHDPDAIRRGFETGDYPYKSKVTEAHYLERMLPLQAELLKAQNWVKESGEKVVVLFEGRDAAGKGGTIKRFMEHLNPRGARIVALEKPNERERTQWYFQRYIQHLPAAGEMVFFDRSWYNRAGVERVMGFCKPNDYLEFMRQCPEVERMFVRSGIRLFKYWFSVTREEQRRRFAARETDPLKQWKLSPIDTPIPRPRKRCSSTPTPPTPPGPSSSRTTRSVLASTPCTISCSPCPIPTRTVTSSWAPTR
jgi:polyphosphate kinase 2